MIRKRSEIYGMDSLGSSLSFIYEPGTAAIFFSASQSVVSVGWE